MPRILAEFISPRVSHIHRADPTIDFLQMDPFFINEKEKDNTDQIKKLIFNLKQICSGLSIDIDEKMSEDLKIFAILNWNDELFNEIAKLFSTNEDQKENQNEKINKYIQYLFNINKSEGYIKYSNNFKQSLIEYLSSHFYLIDKKQLLTFNRYDFYLIITNNKLKINDEDSLFDIINQFYSIQNDEEAIMQKMELYESIKIDELSEEKLKEFLNDIKSDEITQQLWNNIRQYLINNLSNAPKERKDDKRYSKNIKSIDVKYNKTFEGILYKLGEGNPKSTLDKGVIDITVSSIYCTDSSYQPKNVLDFNNDQICFFSNNEDNSWLCIDFKEPKVNPSHYSLKSNGWGGKGYYHLQNWNIEGSNDLKNWDALDTRQNQKSLDDCGASNTFEITNEKYKDSYYRYLRIRQSGLNTHNNYHLALSSIEFYGKLQIQ